MQFFKKLAEFEEESNKDEKHIKKQDIVIGRDFFRELRVKVKYWFKYGRMAKTQEDHNGSSISFEIQDIENTESDLTFWFKYLLKEQEQYVFKVCYRLGEPDADITQLTKIVAYFYCYDNEEFNIIKEMDQNIDVKEDIKEKVFLRTIKDIVKTIIEEPKDESDAKEVADGDDMMDNIY